MKVDRRWELFECQRCGRCCIEIGLPWDPERISEIARFLNLTTDQVIEKYYGRIVEDEDGQIWEEEDGWLSEIFGEEYGQQKKDGRRYIESEDDKRTPCPFLRSEADGKKACIIYEVRPGGCGSYPLDTDGGRGDVHCPGARNFWERLEQRDES